MYRISFSRNVIDLLRTKVGTKYQIEKRKILIGRKLGTNEESKSGLYGIISSHTNKPLRICLDKDIANLLIDNKYRYLAEAYLIPKAQ